jgi:hypothetical protein
MCGLSERRHVVQMILKLPAVFGRSEIDFLRFNYKQDMNYRNNMLSRSLTILQGCKLQGAIRPSHHAEARS